MSTPEVVEKAEKEKESAAERSERIAALTPEQRELLALLRRRKAAEKRPRRPPTAPPIPPRGPGESSPLSFDQERLWFLYYLDPGATAYNIDTSTRMEGRLDVAALVRSLNGVVARHEAWRTTFQARDGRPVQVIAPEVPLDVPVVDLRRVPAGRRDAVARAHQRSEARRPFDLAAGPLVRALLLRLADDAWICMLTVHHIVTDWVTFQLFWRELALLYTGETGLLPALPRQYADFAVWQRAWLSGEVLETYLDFWLRELADAPQVLDLPFDRPRPPIQTTRGAEAAVEILGSLADGLKALARQAGATPFMAVLAVFDALLCRLTGQGKVLVGSPNANRNRVELEPLFGFFLTQLVFVADGSGNPTFRELLGRVRRQALGAYAHQDLPFGKLLEAMRPERDNSRPPLVQANFLLLDSEYTPLELPELQVTPIWVDDGNSRFDLTLGLWDSPSRIFGFFEYNLDLFDPTTVARMAEAFSALVERAVADPEVRLADLPMLSAAARHQVLGEWNDTGTGEREPSVPDLFVARVRERPAALALVCGEEISFAALDRAAERAARRLQAAGIGRGDVVGLALDRSPALGIGVLALWKAGAVLLPLDPAAPRERLAFLLADTGAKALLTRESLRGRLPETDLPVLDLEDGETAATSATSDISERPLPRVGPDDLAYLLYTSGTTGQPKGVAVEHGNLAAILAACRREFRFRPSDRFLAVAPFSFDIFFFELLSPLLAGGCCELFAATSPLDMEALLAGLERATLFHAVPALLRQVLSAVPAVRRENSAAFAALRTVFVGGDAVPADLLASLAENFPQAEARVLYGPTEATILATTERIAAGSASPAARMGTALGRPLPGVRLRVVDPSGGLAGLGVAGELWIGGAGVSRGYIGRESGLAELTADRLVIVDGERWYRTGDRVRFGGIAGMGSMEFLGRVDGQVKIRGFRVEPGEVEAALAADPEVAESVVVARTLSGNSLGDKQLVAYVVPRQGQGPEPGRRELWTGRLAERLRERLPGHLVPSLFVLLDALPLTPHGKVDRKTLPAIDAIAGDAGSAAAPRNEREAALAAVWQGVLGLGRVGIHDNFFQIGGDSILSIQVVARARKAGLVLTPKQLFEHQTIAGLAAIATLTATAEGIAAADAGPVTGEAPLTPIQRAFFAETRPEPWRFNQALLFVSRAALDPRLLGAALDVLVDHHDALRLRFTREEEIWKQMHAPTGCGAPLVTADLSSLPAVRVSPAIESAVAELQGGFDLARGPLFLAALFRCAAGDDDRRRPRLLLAAHHLVVDGVSWRILLEDLETAYGQLTGGERPGLSVRTTSFKSWAERLAAHARSPAVQAELGFWRSQDGGSPLPIDFPGGGGGFAGSAGSAATVSIELPERQTRELLRQAPAAYRTRVDELLLAALAWVLARATGSARVLVDVEGHGREETLAAGTDLSRTVGWFTSVFPLALDLPGTPGPGPAIQAAIKAVKEQLRTVPEKGIGYGLLRWSADPTELSELAGRPTPEVSFNYLGQVDAQLAAAALLAPAAEAIRGTESPGAPRSHLLDVSGLVLGERLRLDLTYSTELHRAATIEGLAADLRDEIAALVDHCMAPEAGGYTPADFPLARLGQAELDALLGSERGIEDLYPLAPLQQGMLFYTLFSPGSELYFEQLTAILRGPLDSAAFARAWQRVIDRHPALRAAFLWEGAEAPLREPLQVIRREVTVEWEVLDWREVPPADIETRFRALAAADRRRGFALARPPLLRLTLVRTGPAEHRLLWSFHHLLFDGWCFSLLFSEVFALYAGLVSGTEPILPPVHPYRDYIAWLAARDPAEAEGFWRRSLAGFAAPTPLPYDHEAAGPGLVAADYREPELDLGPAATASLVALAQRLGVTLNVALQGAWALLLSRFARETDVVFGTVVSGRPADLPEVESIVGLFINTVPVRAVIPAAGSLAAWLGTLREAQAERSQQEWTPLARIQALSDVPAGESLFASLLVFENYPLDAGITGAAARISGLAIDDVAISERTNYALTLTAAARGGDLALRLLHDRRCEPATARRLLGHLAGLLAGFAADPARSPADVPLLDAAERHQLLVEWADTGFLDLAAGPSAPESFRARAAENPGTLAVVAGDERLTYGELARRAERLARRLRALGLGREAVVGLAVGRSLALAVGVLGILEAGAAWVPLDPALPAERLAFLLADSGARAVVTEERFAAGLPTGDLPVLVAVVDEPGETGETAERLPQVSPRDLAYVLYTSGTTGQPKGVLVEHGQLAWILAASRRALGWGRDERVLALAPFSFDISIWELLEPLTQGGACEIFPLDLVPDLVRLAQSLRLATRMHAVPALMRQVAATIRDEGGTYPRLRALYMAGEAVPAALQVEIASSFPGVDVRVLYGPTEGAVFCSGWPVEGDGRAAPLGRAFPGASFRLVDPAGLAGLPVPIGAPGELWLGGAGVARGYRGHPELTAERFVPGPAGERWYRTGDLARLGADGNLEFLGRLDDQVKIRGVRIEPGEIEAVLTALPEVREAAVLALANERGDRRLVAFVVPDPASESCDPERLAARLRAVLPEPLVPAAFVALPALPRTAHGKLDRRALAALAARATVPKSVAAGPGPGSSRSPWLPRNAAEAVLAAVWRDVLKIEEVGLDDNFFRLGGDSILSLQVVARVRRAGLVLTPRQIFEHPTIAALAALVDAGDAANAGKAREIAGGTLPGLAGLDELHGKDWETLQGLLGPELREVEDLYPLAPLQEGMLFHDLYAPGSGLYLQQLSCTLKGPLDRAAFHRAWQGVVDRHPALRTAFVWQGLPRALQVVRRGVVLPWEEVDFRRERDERGGLPEPAETRFERLAAEIRARGLDPGRAPLLSAVLVRTGEEEARFLWTFHHLLLDGWCFALLFRDVFALYAAEVAGHGAAVALRPAPPYRDYIAWLERRDAADSADSERYWRGVLAGFAEATPLPLDRPRNTGAGGGLEILLPTAATLGLAAFARASELTLNSVCQGAWALLLSRYGGGDDVVFGTVVAGRPPELPGVEEMVGLFINTLPVRHALHPAEPVGDLLRRVQAAQVEMRQHEQAPLARVQRWSEVPPGEPLFLSLFVFENFPVDESLARGVGPVAVRDLRIADRTDYPLALALSPATASGRLSLRFAWDGHLEPTTVERLARHYEILLTGLIAGGGERPAGDLPLLSVAERRQLLDEWGRGAVVAKPRPALLLHQLVAAQAARTPDALAILQGEQGERAISYAELDRAAAALALRLRALGVGPEVRVPLLAERSPEAIVGIVAVLAAGGAYVPLDPGAPADRLTLLLAETGGIGAPAPGPLLLTARTAALLPEEARAGFLPVFLDDVLAGGRTGETPAPAVPPLAVLPENLAYVLYTSGSTGNPKGVMVTHGAIAAYVRVVVAEYGVGPGDRELQSSALSFDPSVEEIFAPLTAGGAVVLPAGAFEEPARFLDFCRRTELTLLSLPTAYWHTFVATLEAENLPAPPKVRLAIIGGERALPERWAEWGKLAAGDWGRVRLVNGYGPTEATVAATLETHPGPSAGAAGEVAIGRPLPGVVVRVAGSRQRSATGTDEPLPAGAAGELLLGGAGLARGYLDHPALTADRFVPDPEGAERGEPGARLYRTGDRVRFRADGRLEFLGRVDSQVKVRGFRIELGEVEGALAAHPAVLEAAAGTREDASGSRGLVAWVVPRDAGLTAETLDAPTLVRFLAGRLPAPLVPTEITFLPALPRNAAHKVDRRALARLVPDRAGATVGEDGYLAPRNAMEEEMAALWRDLLGVLRVGVEDDFFALGGHSLLATQLVSRLRRELGVELPLARLFELRTLAAVSREVLDLKLAADGEGVDDLLADLDSLSEEEALALLAAQEADPETSGENGAEERR